MTTDTKPDNTAETAEDNNSVNTANSNKAVFGPLGKYAVIAVIMVSIIVTTAIVLNKELNSVEQEIAVIEDEVADLTVADAEESTDESLTTNSTEVSANLTLDDKVASESVVSTAVNASNTQTVTVASLSETTPLNTAPSAEVLVATATTTETVVTDSVAPVAATKTTTTVKSMQDRQAQLAMNNQARIDAHKLEQKQHMSEMFTRIKTLEAQQLEQYKTRQDTRVERLREQIAKQQNMIDSLISRNKELFELRAASVQKNQTNREQMLNRI
jgi:hypothetical protein